MNPEVINEMIDEIDRIRKQLRIIVSYTPTSDANCTHYEDAIYGLTDSMNALDEALS